MLPENVQWYFPSTLREASKLIQKEGIILHAGGTRILKTQTKSIKGLVEISGLGLNYIKNNKNKISIGAGSTFADVVAYNRATKQLPMLAKALHQAASTPLRNRITIGGSLKDFPLWSSLYAPLLALNAKVKVTGEAVGIYSIEDYVTKNIIKKNHIVKEIIIKEEPGLIADIKRFSLIKFEYPLFTIAAAFKVKNFIVQNARFYITGVKSRFKRFKRAESIFINKQITSELIENSMKFINPKFPSDYKYSSDYKETVSKVNFNDLLTELRKKVV